MKRQSDKALLQSGGEAVTEREAFIARLVALPSVRLYEPRRPLLSGDVVYVTAEGPHTVAWPPEIRWAGNILPTPSPGIDVYEFIPGSNGLWFGSVVGLDFAFISAKR